MFTFPQRRYAHAYAAIREQNSGHLNRIRLNKKGKREKGLRREERKEEDKSVKKKERYKEIAL